MLHWFVNIFFPPKCVLCRRVLTKNETDLCHNCRRNAPEYTAGKNNITFLAGWTAVWYYKDDVRKSLLRYKFGNARSYAATYGRLLAMRIQEDLPEDIDILTWVPVSPMRKFRRGYDQVELLTKEVGKQLGITPCVILKKNRNNPAQSSLATPAQRRANVMGVYSVTDAELVRNKRILLLDDIITTGATISECAKILQFAGAKDVYCAAMAAAAPKK